MTSLTLAAKQKKLATAAERLATSLEKGTFRGTIGRGKAVSKGEPVCAFGVLVGKAGLIEGLQAKTVTQNSNLLKRVLGVTLTPEVSEAAGNVGDANDSQDHGRLVSNLRTFARVIRGATFTKK